MSVTATATGVVCASPNSLCPGPNGDVLYDTTHGWFGGFVLPGAPALGLVGRVGNGPWVQVGSGPTTLSGTGTLVFSVNDYYSYFWDNAGSFTVTATLSYACFPGWGHGDAKHPHVGPPGRIDSCYPGHGYGDTNHSHAGPPGLIDKPNGEGKGGGASGSNDGSKAGGDSPSNGNGQHPPGDPPTPHRTAKTRSRTSESLRLPRPGEETLRERTRAEGHESLAQRSRVRRRPRLQQGYAANTPVPRWARIRLGAGEVFGTGLALVTVNAADAVGQDTIGSIGRNDLNGQRGSERGPLEQPSSCLPLSCRISPPETAKH